MRVHRGLLVGFCGLLATTAVFAGAGPLAVSPGDPAKLVLIGDTCPTFSWSQADGAGGYELVVYRLGEDGAEAKAVLRQAFRGAALGWTPSLDRCLEPGGRYAWSVRAVGGEEAPEWSPPSLFRVTAGPSQEEFEKAVAVVRGYLAGAVPPVPADGHREPGPTAHSGAPALASGAGEAPSPASRWPDGSQDLATLVPLNIGLTVDLADTSGVETWGIWATSQSSEDNSRGVLGQSTATSGSVQGVMGSTVSPDGVGVLGISDHATHGVGVVGEAEGTGLCAGVVGFVESDDGVGGLFWNAGNGDALVVADPSNYPTSVDVKFFVDPQGNVGLVGDLDVDGGVGANSFVGDGSGLTNVPADFASITAGTNTATLVVGSGGSLSVTGTGSVTATAVPASGVTGDGSGSGLDADFLDGNSSAFFQQRVSSSCAAGSAIRVINADGTVTCETDDSADGAIVLKECLNAVSCTCSGSGVLTGGGVLCNTAHRVVENRPSSTTTWEGSCSDGSFQVPIRIAILCRNP